MVAWKHLFSCHRGEGLWARHSSEGDSSRLLTQFVFLTIRPVPGNMVAIDICKKSPIMGERIYMKLCENMPLLIYSSFYSRYYFYFKISVFYCLLLQSWWSLGWLCCCHFFFCCFDCYSYFCCCGCHHYCCFCCWCHCFNDHLHNYINHS